MARILIIDDDTQLVRVLEAYLTRCGHDVAAAFDGRQAIGMLSREMFELVISDIIMPEQDGLEVLMWLRGRPARPRFIAVSGGSARLGQDMLLKLASYTADRVMPKPFQLEELQHAIDELLDSGTLNPVAAGTV